MEIAQLLAECRNKPVVMWMEGDPSFLIEQVMKGDLNQEERALVASIIRGDAPRRQRGAKVTNMKPVLAGLVRFWLRDVDGYESKDAIIRQIEMRLGVSQTMANKYLKQIDQPSTKGQAVQRMIFDLEKRNREILLTSDDPEHIEIVAAQREHDLKPIPKK